MFRGRSFLSHQNFHHTWHAGELTLVSPVGPTVRLVRGGCFDTCSETLITDEMFHGGIKIYISPKWGTEDATTSATVGPAKRSVRESRGSNSRGPE